MSRISRDKTQGGNLYVKKGDVISLMDGFYDESRLPMVALKSFDLEIVALELSKQAKETLPIVDVSCFCEHLIETGYLTRPEFWNVSVTSINRNLRLEIIKNASVVKQPALSTVPTGLN